MTELPRKEESGSGCDSFAKTRSSADFVRALTQAALASRQTAAFVAVAGRALVLQSLRVDRLFVSVKALHPAFRARTYLWRRDINRVDTVEWPHGLEIRSGYYDSPDHFVHRTGSELRVRHPGESSKLTCDLYETLRVQGYTDYLIVPLRLGDGTINTLSIATKEPQGFRDSDLDWFREHVPLFTLILERHVAAEALNVVLDVYLGSGVSQQIMHGQIRAGDGELIDAAILMADLRGFTQHATRLGAAATVRLLNGYFDCLVSPIREHGGYVLKFIGDAVLAFFPILQGGPAPNPLKTVLEIRQRLAALNSARMDAQELPLRHALCFHYGRVLYGNIGSSDRLDFTIIGEAVNLAARGVEAAKSADAEYLFTVAFAERFGTTGLARCGSYALRGFPEPLVMFSLADSAAP